MTPLKYKNEIVEHEELLSGFSAPVTNSVKPRWQRKKERLQPRQLLLSTRVSSALNNSINSNFSVSHTPRKRGSSHSVATPRSKKRARPSSKSSVKKKGLKLRVTTDLSQIGPQQT